MNNRYHEGGASATGGVGADLPSHVLRDTPVAPPRDWHFPPERIAIGGSASSSMMVHATRETDTPSRFGFFPCLVCPVLLWGVCTLSSSVGGVFCTPRSEAREMRMPARGDLTPSNEHPSHSVNCCEPYQTARPHICLSRICTDPKVAPPLGPDDATAEKRKLKAPSHKSGEE